MAAEYRRRLGRVLAYTCAVYGSERSGYRGNGRQASGSVYSRPGVWGSHARRASTRQCLPGRSSNVPGGHPESAGVNTSPPPPSSRTYRKAFLTSALRIVHPIYTVMKMKARQTKNPTVGGV